MTTPRLKDDHMTDEQASAWIDDMVERLDRLSLEDTKQLISRLKARRQNYRFPANHRTMYRLCLLPLLNGYKRMWG